MNFDKNHKGMESATTGTSDNLKKEWAYQQYVNRESNVIHAPYEPEMDFYNAVKTGDIKRVQSFTGNFATKEGLGVLSDNLLRNAIYHFIIAVAMIARSCISAGLPHEEAYSLSDFYIRKADTCRTITDINELHTKMVIDYTEKMRSLQKGRIFSRHILSCINYIYDHLHTRITVETLAEHVGLNPTYLSKLFKQETGQSISAYITTQKIETAKNMLLYSDFTPSQIALILAFPSQSYFTEIFRKQTGYTPGNFRKRGPV